LIVKNIQNGERKMENEKKVLRTDTIKHLILAGLKSGKSTKEIAVELVEKFPMSMASAKSVKHIAWYRTKVKQGKITLPA
jgi:hypothetical protein